MKHAFTSAKSDGADATLVQPSDWNAAHVEGINTVAASGDAETLDVSAYSVHDVTLTDNCTFIFTGATNGQADTMTVMLRQDATGSRTVTWPASVEFPGDSTPLLSTVSNAVDILTFLTVDGGTTWFGFYARSDASGSIFHGARALQSANSNLTNGSVAYVAFDGADDYDTDGYHNPASNNTRLTVPTGLSGYYHITAAALVTNDPGRMYCVIRKNGTTIVATGAVYESATSGASAAMVSCTLNLAEGDYVEFGIKVTANSKTAGDSGVAEPFFEMYKVG